MSNLSSDNEKRMLRNKIYNSFYNTWIYEYLGLSNHVDYLMVASQ